MLRVHLQSLRGSVPTNTNRMLSPPSRHQHSPARRVSTFLKRQLWTPALGIAVDYYTILCYTILYYTILYYTILYYTILYYTILYYIILYYTILYYTILYYTILYYTILHYMMIGLRPPTETSPKKEKAGRDRIKPRAVIPVAL